MEKLSDSTHVHPVGISVLICTYNGAKRLPSTLAHLAKQKVLANVCWEVILVDNASTDSTLNVAQAYWQQAATSVPLILLSQPRSGKNYALELGYNSASYSYLCIVDDDNWLADNYLQNGYELLHNNPSIGLLGGKNTAAFEISPPHWFSRFQDYYAVGTPLNLDSTVPQPMTDGQVTNGTLWGAGLFMRHSVWAEMSELNFKSLLSGRQGESNLVAGEDHELCYAATIMGYVLWYSSSLQLTHFMTKGRLNKSYRNRLLSAVAKGYLMLMPYRNMNIDRIGNNTQKSSSLTVHVLKDHLYIFKDTLTSLFSLRYINSLLGRNELYRINSHAKLSYICSFVFNSKIIKENYERVFAFKQQVKHKRLLKASF